MIAAGSAAAFLTLTHSREGRTAARSGLVGIVLYAVAAVAFGGDVRFRPVVALVSCILLCAFAGVIPWGRLGQLAKSARRFQSMAPGVKQPGAIRPVA
jgi:hypothetical protein